VPGRYVDGRPFSGGFPENVEFFRLQYLDAAEIEFGLRFSELHPLLWLRAGGIGEREDLDPTKPLGLPQRSPYAVLFKPSGLPELLASLPGRPDINTVFIAADSADSFAALAAQIEAESPEHIDTVRLYREYLETLRGAIR
jgi:adenine-specific DNA-methyltransferase